MSDPSEASWEKAISKEIRRRIGVTAEIDRNPRNAAVARRVIADQREGLSVFVGDFVWTFDPRLRVGQPKDLPLLLWPRQAEFLAWLQRVEEAGDDGVVDKSRDVGVTWLVVAYFVWRWLTVPGWAGAIGSRKEDLMDRLGDPKTVFWKIEYVIRMLPAWLLPKGFDDRKHRAFGKLINPENGATITGEAGPEMGRGGRSSMYFLDEYGIMPRAQSVKAAVADNAASVIYASTATGPDTEFYSLVHDGNIPHFRISWQHDPRKSPEWRDDYLRKYGVAITAREVDINYSGGGDSEVIPYDWVRAAIDLDLSFEGGPIIAGFDVADSGEAESVLVERQGPRVLAIRAWRGVNPVESAHRVAEYAEAAGASLVRFDSIGVGAGVSGGFASRDRLPFQYSAVNVGTATTGTRYEDAPDRSARDRFANLKAELWWSLRLRFWNSFRLHKGEPVDPASCISIPDDRVLVAQISTPKIESNERGLMRIESKDALRRRGVRSPDRADALVLAFADVVGASGLTAVSGRVDESDAIGYRDRSRMYGTPM